MGTIKRSLPAFVNALSSYEWYDKSSLMNVISKETGVAGELEVMLVDR